MSKKMLTTLRIVAMTMFGFFLVLQPAFDYGHYAEAFRDLRATLSVVGFVLVISAIAYATRKIRFGFSFEELKRSDDPNVQAKVLIAICIVEAATLLAAAILNMH